MLGTRRAFTSALAAAAFVLSAGGLAQQAAAQGKDVVILAAASLKNALDEASADWTKKTGKKTRISYASSSELAKQMEGGIPADIFISADVPWMDYVAERKLIKPASRSNFLGNQIVLIAGKGSRIDLKIDNGFDLRGALGKDGRLAMGSVEAVPAGKYGKAALEYLGVWPSVADSERGVPQWTGHTAIIDPDTPPEAPARGLGGPPWPPFGPSHESQARERFHMDFIAHHRGRLHTPV